MLFSPEAESMVIRLFYYAVSKPKGKRTLGRPKQRRRDNIKTDVKEVGRVLWSGFSFLRMKSRPGLS
jgi:hypothetical protein